MSDIHPTITDKDREVGMDEDDQWHATQIRDFNGDIEPDFEPPLVTGDDPTKKRIYIVTTTLRGCVVTMPNVRSFTIRYDRYPFDSADNGTYWTRVSLRDLDEVDSSGHPIWLATIIGKMEIYPAGGSYSTSMGVGYRAPSDAALRINSRVVKFVRQLDE